MECFKVMEMLVVLGCKLWIWVSLESPYLPSHLSLLNLIRRNLQKNAVTLIPGGTYLLIWSGLEDVPLHGVRFLTQSLS